MTADDDELVAVFRAESHAIMDELGQALLAVEREGPGGAAQEEAYRLFHTLKGMCNMAGHDEVGALCHRAEAALAPGETPAVDPLLSVLDEVTRRLGVDREAGEAAERRNLEPASETTYVSVDVRRLDNLLNLVGELTVAETQLVYEWRTRGAIPSEEAVSRFSLLVRSLQEEVMRARLLPVRTLFASLPRLARDAAKAQGKRVRLALDDAGLALDRSIVDRMGGVLAHLIQNAVVHGIEPPEERSRAGKPAEGLVQVRSRRENETLVIEVEDDGRGIDRDRVRSRAVEKGLLTAEEAAALSPQQITDLMLTPGFSTATETTRHAGRGVGLTAAWDSVRAAGGSLSVDSAPGRGARVSLRLPPTVAVLETLLARDGGAMVAVPLRNVVRIAGAGETRLIKGIPSLVHDGRPVPVLTPKGEAPVEGASPFVIVTQSARGVFGLAVERVVGTHSSILKPLDAALMESASALGATVLGSGLLAVVLDPDAFQGVLSE